MTLKSRFALLPLVTSISIAGCGSSPPPKPAATEPRPTIVAAPPGSASVSAPTGDAPAFSVEAPPKWSKKRNGSVDELTGPEGNLHVTVLARPKGDLTAIISESWKAHAPTMALPEKSRKEPVGSDRFEKQMIVTYISKDEKDFAQAIALATDKGVFVLLVRGPIADVAKRNAEVVQIMDSLEVGKKSQQFKASDAKRLSREQVATIFADAQAVAKRDGIASGVMVVVQGADTFVHGYGTNKAGAPTDGDTRFMIGSITKSFSTALLATLVDEKRVAWDTPVTDVYPKFRLADPAATKKVLMRHLFCACTGLPRSDVEILFNYSKHKPNDVFDSVARLTPTTGFGETFQYNNQLTGVGGLLSGRLASPGVDMDRAYLAALDQRILKPLGMGRSTMSWKALAQDKNYAIPHRLEGDKTTAVRLSEERFVDPIKPAGGLWSTANDMAHYIRMQLSGGKSQTGKQVVSKEQLDFTHRPQVAIRRELSYAMGWMVGKARGVKILTHDGGTLGFHSHLIIFPELNLGLFSVGNRSPASAFHQTLDGRILEELFGADLKLKIKNAYRLKERAKGVAKRAKELSATAPPKTLIGRYKHPELGVITIKRGSNRLVLSTADWESGLALLKPDVRKRSLRFTSGPLTGESLQFSAKAPHALTLKSNQHEYVFARQR